jgi:hypothetical protein
MCLTSRILTSLGIVAGLLTTSSPSQTHTFERWFGNYKYDEGFAVKQTRDGGYILAGATYTLTSSGLDFYAVRLNALGDTLWTRAIGRSGSEAGRSVLQTSDGGFIIAGTHTYFHADSNAAVLLRFDSLGTLLWRKTLNFSTRAFFWSMCATQDGGLMCAGTTEPGPYGGRDGWLVRTNQQGDTLWTRCIGSAGDDSFRSIHAMPDGGFIIVGSVDNTVTGSPDFLLVQVDSLGYMNWTRTYGTGDNDVATSVDVLDSGGLIVAGISISGAPPSDSARFVLLKTSVAGDTVWSRSWPDASVSSTLAAETTRDGGFVLCGTSISPSTGEDALLMKTDGSGIEQWRRPFGRAFTDAGDAVAQCSDGGYVLAGMVAENTFDALIEKTDSLGIVTAVRAVLNGNLPASPVLLQTYPNPFNPATTIAYYLPGQMRVRLRVVDMLGRSVAVLVDRLSAPGWSTVAWDAHDVASGIYFCQLITSESIRSIKLMLVR